jgi:hypothetical protein
MHDRSLFPLSDKLRCKFFGSRLFELGVGKCYRISARLWYAGAGLLSLTIIQTLLIRIFSNEELVKVVEFFYSTVVCRYQGKVMSLRYLNLFQPFSTLQAFLCNNRWTSTFSFGAKCFKLRVISARCKLSPWP